MFYVLKLGSTNHLLLNLCPKNVAYHIEKPLVLKRLCMVVIYLFGFNRAFRLKVF